MPFDVTMPKLTDSMEEGRIVEWKVAPGDRVREGDVLAEIETDKAVMELESFWTGTVAELLHGNGDVAAVGEVIARIADVGEEVGAAAPSQEAQPVREPEPPAEVAAAPAGRPSGEPEAAEGRAGVSPEAEAPGPAAGKEPAKTAAPPEVPLPGAHPLSERAGAQSPRPAPAPRRPAQGAEQVSSPPRPAGIKASPRARRLARDKGVDLAQVRGTGPEGRITTADVEAAAPKGAPAQGARAVGPAESELPPVAFAEGEAEVQEVSFYQKAALRRVSASARSVPHFYVSARVRAETLLKRKEETGEGVTLTHFLLRAAALALEKFPDANRSYDRGRWLRWKVVNLGLAVQTDAGLAVGVLRGAQGKDLAWIAERTRDLVERARAGRLRPEERTNATFTLSNLGAYWVESFTAIINPPSALTLAAGAVLDAPVVREGRVEAGRVLGLTLSCDHRVVDGVLAARFLGGLQHLLEHPEEL